MKPAEIGPIFPFIPFNQRWFLIYILHVRIICQSPYCSTLKSAYYLLSLFQFYSGNYMTVLVFVNYTAVVADTYTQTHTYDVVRTLSGMVPKQIVYSS